MKQFLHHEIQPQYNLQRLKKTYSAGYHHISHVYNFSYPKVDSLRAAPSALALENHQYLFLRIFSIDIFPIGSFQIFRIMQYNRYSFIRSGFSHLVCFFHIFVAMYIKNVFLLMAEYYFTLWI